MKIASATTNFSRGESIPGLNAYFVCQNREVRERLFLCTKNKYFGRRTECMESRMGGMVGNTGIRRADSSGGLKLIIELDWVKNYEMKDHALHFQ